MDSTLVTLLIVGLVFVYVSYDSFAPAENAAASPCNACASAPAQAADPQGSSLQQAYGSSYMSAPSSTIEIFGTGAPPGTSESVRPADQEVINSLRAPNSAKRLVGQGYAIPDGVRSASQELTQSLRTAYKPQGMPAPMPQPMAQPPTSSSRMSMISDSNPLRGGIDYLRPHLKIPQGPGVLVNKLQPI
jgi:hypothetical protein